MAYDPEKAHEYYMKYRKKGLLKGRKRKSTATANSKKGSKKKINLVGLSTSGLNEAGAMKWALAKERLTNEMNTAMSQAKTPEEKDKIRQEYQNKALAELQAIKSDPSTAKAKTTKARSAGGSKSSGTKEKSNKKDSSKESDTTSTEEKPKKSKKAKKLSAEQIKKAKAQKKKVEDKIGQLRARLSTMSEIERNDLKNQLQDEIARLTAKKNSLKKKIKRGKKTSTALNNAGEFSALYT